MEKGKRPNGRFSTSLDRNAMIELIDGHYVIADAETQLPGAYSTYEAAELALTLANDELTDLQEYISHRYVFKGKPFITLEDIHNFMEF